MSKTSLVTGGANGIGLEIVNYLLARGDEVIVFDYIDDNDPRVQKLISQGVDYIQVNISSVTSINDGFNKLFSKYEKLDILVNNAGVTRDNLAIRLSEEEWDSVLDVNLKGLFFCAQHAVKRMLKKRSGYIINISSIVGQTGNPGQVNYAASKAGVISLTKTLAAEYGSKNIVVNAIAPGFIKTEMTDRLSDSVKEKILERVALKRFGEVSDVAKLVEFLTSGNADYISGTVINIDGGIN